MNTTFKIYLAVMTVLIVGFLVSATLGTNWNEPLAVTRQSGFVIDVDNELMILACKYHNIDSDDIRWDTVNDNFVFYRDEHKCHVFTNAFKEYLDSLSYEKTIDTIK